MGLSLIRYAEPGVDEPLWGELEQGRVFELPWEDGQLRTILENQAERRASAERQKRDTGLSLEDVVLHSPLTSDCTLLCQGLNYAQHKAEAGLAEHSVNPEDNLIFSKSSASLCGARDSIKRPADCKLLDYEAELGLVIGRAIDQPVRVGPDQLKDYVAGLVICNDVSSRDEQMGAPGMQWFKGKSYRTFCPAGPILYLLDSEDMHAVENMNISLWVNGSLRQQANSSQLLHKPHDTLTAISEFTNLRPGDCLLTGTPGGVAFEMDLKTGLAIMLNMRRDGVRKRKLVKAQEGRTAYLRNGDVVEIAIESDDGKISLGRQCNVVTAN